MRKLWRDPFLWIHAAGIVAFPLWLGIMVVGLATGDPILPVGIEQALVAVVGIVPVFVMQWQRPFDIFSILVVALPPDQLSAERRRVLSGFLTQEHKILTVLVAILMLELSERLYEIAPLFESWTPVHFSGGARLTGLFIASFGFLGANVFLQIPVAVTRVLLLSDIEIDQLPTPASTEVEEQFTIVGRRNPDLLARLETYTEPVTATPVPVETEGSPDAPVVEDSA